jgi:cell division protein FtsQ
VHEQEPVGARPGDGTAQVLMADGSVLPHVPQSALESRALVRVTPGVLRADADTRHAVAQVVVDLPAGLHDQVEEVSADGAEAVELRLSDGIRVVWGAPEEADVKAAVIESLLAQDQEALASVEEIDVSVADRPVTR